MPLIAMTRDEAFAEVAASVPGVKSARNHLKSTAGSRFKDDY